MCTGIAVPLYDVPSHFAAAVAPHLHEREGRPEYQFHWWQKPTVLPVRWDGRFDLLPWGSKARRGPLPIGGWVRREQVADGQLGRVEEAVIPAVLGQHAGAWYLVMEGIRAVVLRTAAGPVVYMLTEPASNYYRNMTQQAPLMPVFVNQTI